MAHPTHHDPPPAGDPAHPAHPDVPGSLAALECCPRLEPCQTCDELDIRYRVPFRRTIRVQDQPQTVTVMVTLHFRFKRCTGPLTLGDLLYTTTLLPGEQVRLFTSDRHSRFTFDASSQLSYRHHNSSEESFYTAESGKVYEFDNEELADRFIFYEDKYVPDSPDQVVPPGGYLNENALGGFYIAKGYDRWQERQKPVETFTEGGVKAKVDVSYEGVVDGGASAEQVLGRKIDTKTHNSTTYSKTSVELAGQVGLQVEAGGKLKGEAISAYTHDASGRPAAYSVTLSGTAEGHAGYTGTGDSEKVGGGLSHHESQGVRIERQMTLDLSDPENRAAVERYVESGGSDPVATAKLAERMHEDARVDQRVYDTGSTKSGANVDVKIVKIDGSMSTEESTLRSMQHSNPGGPTVHTMP